MSDGSGATAWGYDQDGNTAAVRKTVNSVTKEADYTYNADSTVNTLSDFGGTVFTYSYDSAGHATQVADGSGYTYATGAIYTAAGQLSSLNHQLTSGSALYQRSWQYNNRLQPSVISATLNSNTIQSLSYGYGSSGTNNGNVLAITNGMDNSRNQTYTYDNVNRLASGRDTSHWGESYTYNSSGDLYQTTPMSGLAGNSWSVTAYNSNRLSNLAYDSAGEVATDQFSNSYSYDGEGHVLSVGSNAYVYDADGSRVKKSGGTSRLYWTGANGEVLNESDLSGNMASAYVYFDGVRIARRDTPSSVDVRFTNDSCSGCGGTPVGGGDRNFILNSLSVGSTTIPYNDPSINYTSDGCSSISGGALWVPCNGDVLLQTSLNSPKLGFNGWGQSDYSIYPHVQIYGNGVLAGEFNITGSSQSYSANAVYFYLQDHLGSARMVVSAGGGVLDDIDRYPFGGLVNNFGNGLSGNHYTFADYESDLTESSSYHTSFRQLSPSLGRWMRPDPYLGSIDITNPQSLNRYSYVTNSPLVFTDPSGLDEFCFADSNCNIWGPGIASGGGVGVGAGGGGGSAFPPGFFSEIPAALGQYFTQMAGYDVSGCQIDARGILRCNSDDGVVLVKQYHSFAPSTGLGITQLSDGTGSNSGQVQLAAYVPGRDEAICSAVNTRAIDGQCLYECSDREQVAWGFALFNVATQIRPACFPGVRNSYRRWSCPSALVASFPPPGIPGKVNIVDCLP
jgi:RHS repeat-associated protein